PVDLCEPIVTQMCSAEAVISDAVSDVTIQWAHLMQFSFVVLCMQQFKWQAPTQLPLLQTVREHPGMTRRSVIFQIDRPKVLRVDNDLTLVDRQWELRLRFGTSQTLEAFLADLDARLSELAHAEHVKETV
ncbi:MAG: hypothetical protein ACKO6N_24780, partial [Myxococcota bacterium]